MEVDLGFRSGGAGFLGGGGGFDFLVGLVVDGRGMRVGDLVMERVVLLLLAVLVFIGGFGLESDDCEEEGNA